MANGTKAKDKRAVKPTTITCYRIGCYDPLARHADVTPLSRLYGPRERERAEASLIRWQRVAREDPTIYVAVAMFPLKYKVRPAVARIR